MVARAMSRALSLLSRSLSERLLPVAAIVFVLSRGPARLSTAVRGPPDARGDFRHLRRPLSGPVERWRSWMPVDNTLVRTGVRSQHLRGACRGRRDPRRAG